MGSIDVHAEQIDQVGCDLMMEAVMIVEK